VTVYSAYQACFPYFVTQIQSKTLLGTPVYNLSDNQQVAFLYSVRTTFEETNVYEDMKEWVQTLTNFTEQHSGGVQGFFTGDFLFYALQDQLGSGMWVALGISLSLSTLIMLVTTLNVLITVHAVFCIALSIFGTVGALVLMGWELSIVESAILTLAVGLSIDFTIHYGVAYVQSSKRSPPDRVQESFQRVGSSVTMAGLTTFIAGAMIMPSHILAYRQLGIFLMLVMTVAWLFSTLLFQAMCSVLGPRGDFLQLTCRRREKELSDAKTPNEGQGGKGAMPGGMGVQNQGYI
jgi:predicted RND superfamily exporter protein